MGQFSVSSNSRDQWDFIQEQASGLLMTSAHKRLRLALAFYYTTGLRLIEGVQAKCDDLRSVEYPDPETGGITTGWELLVLGKGNKERIVSVPDFVVAQLGEYLVARGLDADPTSSRNRSAYLFGLATDISEMAPGLAGQPVDPKAGVSHSLIYLIFKRFFTQCSVAMSAIDSRGAERIAQASTHWLRHTHGTHAVAGGMPLDVVQQNLGHASLDTTTGYTTSEERRRMLASQTYWDQKL